MTRINKFFNDLSSLETIFYNPENKINDDRENYILLKIAACIPYIGLTINKKAFRSLNEKLKRLPLPKSLRSDPMLGEILKENASPEEIKTSCKRAIQLESIKRDYIKTALANNLLTIALAVSGLAMNIIPFFVGAILIGGFSVTTTVFAFDLCTDDSMKRYEKVLDSLS